MQKFVIELCYLKKKKKKIHVFISSLGILSVNVTTYLYGHFCLISHCSRWKIPKLIFFILILIKVNSIYFYATWIFWL